MTKMRRGYKRLHRPDGIWQWRAGLSVVTIYDPGGRRLTVTCDRLTRCGDWERAKWKGYDQITPAMVVDWIENKRRDE